MAVGSAVLLVGSFLLGFMFATRRLDLMRRPRISYGGPAIIIMVLGFASYLAGVVLIWTANGWVWGLAAVVVGFWVLPSIFEGFFASIYRRP